MPFQPTLEALPFSVWIERKLPCSASRSSGALSSASSACSISPRCSSASEQKTRLKSSRSISMAASACADLLVQARAVERHPGVRAQQVEELQIVGVERRLLAEQLEDRDHAA